MYGLTTDQVLILTCVYRSPHAWALAAIFTEGGHSKVVLLSWKKTCHLHLKTRHQDAALLLASSPGHPVPVGARSALWW